MIYWKYRAVDMCLEVKFLSLGSAVLKRKPTKAFKMPINTRYKFENYRMRRKGKYGLNNMKPRKRRGSLPQRLSIMKPQKCSNSSSSEEEEYIPPLKRRKLDHPQIIQSAASSPEHITVFDAYAHIEIDKAGLRPFVFLNRGQQETTVVRANLRLLWTKPISV